MAKCTTPAVHNQLLLPYKKKDEWTHIEAILNWPLKSLEGLDRVLTEFAKNKTQQKCVFFSKLPGSKEAAKFDFNSFWKHGVPFLFEVALEMPVLFEGVELPLLLEYETVSVTLSRRQCACLLAHSFFGSITSSARAVRKEKWAFRAAQLFFLEAVPSALCFLNYFKLLGLQGLPMGSVSFERCGFPRNLQPWRWEDNSNPMCPIEVIDAGSIEDSICEIHADFANKFVGGGCLENDFAMEEILFIVKPELIVSMALCSHLQDEEIVRITGALQFSCYSGYLSTFEFEGDYDGRRSVHLPPATVVAMDALQGCAKIQFGEGLIRRDLNKARIAFDGGRGRTVATGNWGCGAFGNDHVLKFLQQWLAASDAGVSTIVYHTYGDARATALPALATGLQALTVGELWEVVLAAAAGAVPGHPGAAAAFRRCVTERAESVPL